jgi:transposase InsO family protein
MLIHLHKQATTTPKVRAAIKASTEPASALAERLSTTEQTVYKWKHRDSVHDRSHTPHRLQTTLTPAQEAVVVVLRKTLLVSIDDLLAVVRKFLHPEVSHSGLDRSLRRHGVGNLRDLQAKDPRPKHKAFKAYEPGYLHVDVKYLPQMADETSRRYRFVAIDRATRWVFIRIYKSKTAANARRFLRDLERACPFRIRAVLTDNGKELTDRLFGLRKRVATGKHEFDQLCADLGIEHRLAPPQHPQTNGMVERFNGRIEEVLQSHHFHSGEELEPTRHRYVLLYDQQLPQSALGSKTPLQAMKDWHKLKQQLFRKQPYHLPGRDTYPQREHVVIDGASTDGTLEVLRAVAGPQSVLVSEPDTGIYDALNKGIALARGEVIGLLHSDVLFSLSEVLTKIHMFCGPEGRCGLRRSALCGGTRYLSCGPALKSGRFFSRQTAPGADAAARPPRPAPDLPRLAATDAPRRARFAAEFRAAVHASHGQTGLKLAMIGQSNPPLPARPPLLDDPHEAP